MADESWKIDKVVKAEEKKLHSALILCGDIAVAEIKSGCPVKTGNLRNSTDKKVVKHLHIRVFNNAEYAADVEFGTAPHEIKPLEKEALAWGKEYEPGKFENVFKKVDHPGIEAQPYFRPGINVAYPKMMRFLKQWTQR